MAERLIGETRVAELTGPEEPIARAPLGVTAFVGRTLRGPINQPVPVSSFDDFERVFGGLWQPSTLSYAVEQYFENGGREAWVVRVVNGGRAPTIQLRAGTQHLRLLGLAPGSRENLRASVDYDGIAPYEEERFNLVLQRVRGAGTELVEEQETFRKLSIRPDGGRYVADALLESRLARIDGEVPSQRPERTPATTPGGFVGWVQANNDGDDGAAITDYDVIGSASSGSGLFALDTVPHFDLLCIPPLSREQDVGSSTLLVASRLCRARHAMLLVDPPLQWDTPAKAVEGARRTAFRADCAVMFYPRITTLDRLRGRHETFAPSGAVAGMLARNAAARDPWAPGESDEILLRSGLRPAIVVPELERHRLDQCGVNSLSSVRIAYRDPLPARTLAAGSSGASDWRYLAPRRLANCLVQSIESGTRWLMFEHDQRAAWRRAERQVESFLAQFDREGAFPGGRSGENCFAICDERVNPIQLLSHGAVRLLFAYAAARTGEFHGFLIEHSRQGSRVRHVSLSRFATSPALVQEEIERALLAGTPGARQDR